MSARVGSVDARWPDPAWVAAAIGRRVSVRSSAGVPGPTGGPGFRDVVGVLESIDTSEEPRWLIRTRTGDLVEVRPAAVVAAKIVPEFPTRLRSASEIDIASVEAIAAEAWQPLEREGLGDWVLRAAAGFTGRANSVLPLGDPGMPVDEALAVVKQWYTARSLPSLIQLPLPLLADLDLQLSERGWERDHTVAVMVCDIAQLLITTHQAPESATVDISGTPDAAWLASFRYGETPVPVSVVPIMTRAVHPVFASARSSSGDTLAIGRGAIIGPWLAITAVEVAAPYRRSGLGTSVLGALARYASIHGSRHVLLQVAHDNPNARSLYDRLGFVAHHDYVYRLLTTGRR
ncbi:MAG: GNAT family N-acetyltransferase [Actinomycetia bacterium]|nr:GNAT family N-acetyltransferase [Actinomycetes bacterium]